MDGLKEDLPEEGIESPEYFKKSVWSQKGQQRSESILPGVSSSSSSFREYVEAITLLTKALGNKMTILMPGYKHPVRSPRSKYFGFYHVIKQQSSW